MAGPEWRQARNIMNPTISTVGRGARMGGGSNTILVFVHLPNMTGGVMLNLDLFHWPN